MALLPVNDLARAFVRLLAMPAGDGPIPAGGSYPIAGRKGRFKRSQRRARK